MIALLEALVSLDVEIEPTFREVALEGEAEGVIRVWPIRAVPPVLRFGLSGPTIRAAWKVVKMERSE